MNTIPQWATEHAASALRAGETVRFVGAGRLDTVPPSGIMAMFYWSMYILTNYLAILYSAFFRNRAVVLITDQRVIIISERSWNFPLWVIPFSRRSLIESIALADLTSISTVRAMFLWGFRANGLQFECESGTTRIINGLTTQIMDEARAFLKA